jgi:hypothetical protein
MLIQSLSVFHKAKKRIKMKKLVTEDLRGTRYISNWNKVNCGDVRRA